MSSQFLPVVGTVSFCKQFLLFHHHHQSYADHCCSPMLTGSCIPLISLMTSLVWPLNVIINVSHPGYVDPEPQCTAWPWKPSTNLRFVGADIAGVLTKINVHGENHIRHCTNPVVSIGWVSGPLESHQRGQRGCVGATHSQPICTVYVIVV